MALGFPITPDSIQSRISSRDGRKELLQARGEDARRIVNVLDQTLARSDLNNNERFMFLVTLRKLCGNCCILPDSHHISEGLEVTSSSPDAGGGFADVYKGSYGGKLVAIKTLRTTAERDALLRIKRTFLKEAAGWKHLDHPNVLPFLGASVDALSISLVSLWMDNGNINEYISRNLEANRLQLLVDVADGVEYLHSVYVIHGDLKGANILISAERRAILADFGLINVVSDSGTTFAETSATVGGTTRWMSPELLSPEHFDLSRIKPTVASDVYALGMVVLEVLSGTQPFAEIARAHLITIHVVIYGKRPLRPANSADMGISDELWQLLQSCWKLESEGRPTVVAVRDLLHGAAPTWDSLTLTRTASEADSTNYSDATTTSSLEDTWDIKADADSGAPDPVEHVTTEVEGGVIFHAPTSGASQPENEDNSATTINASSPAAVALDGSKHLVRSNDFQSDESLLPEDEREAVADLLQFLENRTTTNFFAGSPLSVLKTLSFSGNVDLQRSAALTFAEITEKEVRPVGRDTLGPIIFLLNSQDPEVQRAASRALGNLAVNPENKVLIVKLGGLEPLIRQMLSPNVEVQRNAVGCVINLATHDENKNTIAKSGALVPLTRLASSEDMRIKRDATGALLNLTHSEENRKQLVNAGSVPVLVSLLKSLDTDVQYYSTTALSNIAVDGIHRKKLAQSEPELVSRLVKLMESPSLKVQCQATLALRNLASEETYQLEVVKADGLTPLLRLLRSTYLPLILSAAACVRNLSIHPQNESQIIESGFLQPLINLLAFKDNAEVQCHAISTLRNLAASSEKNQLALLKAGAVQSIKELILGAATDVQSEMTACLAILALSDELKGQLLGMGICEVLIPLTNSPSIEVQGNSAAALGNLSSKNERTATDDYSAFNDVWDKPEGGMHNYLDRFLTSSDTTFQHIAVWTMVQLLESGDPQLIHNIRNSHVLPPHIRRLAGSHDSKPYSNIGIPDSHLKKGGPDQETEPVGGEEEIRLLSRRILEFIEIDAKVSATPRATPPQRQLGIATAGDSVVGGRDFGSLTKSIRNLFSSYLN